jgi:hypothetical protein
MATKPATWSNEQWEKHVSAVKAEEARRASVGDHAEEILSLRARVDALEGKRAPAATPPAAPKAKRSR